MIARQTHENAIRCAKDAELRGKPQASVFIAPVRRLARAGEFQNECEHLVNITQSLCKLVRY